MRLAEQDLTTSEGVAFFAAELLNLICKTVQDRIGQTDGGWASIYWSGNRGLNMEAQLIDYINTEINNKQREDEHE